MNSTVLKLFLLLVGMSLPVLTVAAQDTASLTGTVRDTSGAVLPRLVDGTMAPQ